MTHADFIDAIRQQLPEHEREDAERIALATCAALGSHLAGMEARAVARGLPAKAAEALQGEEFVAGLDRGDLEERLAAELDVTGARAHELAAIVGTAIADRMDDEADKHLAHAEPSIRALFARHAISHPPPHPGARSNGTIAGGRGGGTPPLSEAHTGGRRPLADAHPDRGQPDSIARSDDPRADRRLSSAEPDHTLSRGKPPDPTPED